MIVILQQRVLAQKISQFIRTITKNEGLKVSISEKEKKNIYLHIYRVFLKGLYKIVGEIVDMEINIIK